MGSPIYIYKQLLVYLLILAVESPCLAAHAQSALTAPEKRSTSTAKKPNIPAGSLKPMKPKLDDSLDKPPPTAPDYNKTTSTQASPANKSAPQPAQPSETYPFIAELEKLTFGVSHPNLPITARLSKLEHSVYQKTFPELTFQQRRDMLGKTLLGEPSLPQAEDSTAQSTPQSQSPNVTPGNSSAQDLPPNQTNLPPDYLKAISLKEMEEFALAAVNHEREQLGLSTLVWDDLAYRVGKSQADFLAKENQVSHYNDKGENPDFRYTQSGGVDAIAESIVVLNKKECPVANKALVLRLLHAMRSHQDDRDALFSPDASHFAFCLSNNSDKVYCVINIVNKHGIMHPLPEVVKLGDKITVKGVILAPYVFDRITLAWEGLASEPPPSDGSNDAMPYFPPLDYIAYAHKAERDNFRMMNILKTTGIVAALAGGVFIPPVALAAPLIAMAPDPVTGELKAVSEIPVKGGVKVDGSMFQGTIPITNEGKDGIYYITVWAHYGDSEHKIPISRRAIIVKSESTSSPPGSENTEQTESAAK